MTQGHPSLEWLVRRRDGESAALIAERDGVSKYAVLWATKPYGPFPRPTEQLGRRTLSAETLDARTRRWVQQRRRGVAASVLARESGVGHQVVSRATKGQGPFPAIEVVQEWVAARRERKSLAEIAAEYGTTAGLVRARTAPHGPFRPPGPRAAAEVETVASIARRVGLRTVTVMRWQRTGRLPEPDFVTARGRPVWLPATVERWLEEADLEVCPDCGALAVSVSRHRAQAHR